MDIKIGDKVYIEAEVVNIDKFSQHEYTVKLKSGEQRCVKSRDVRGVLSEEEGELMERLTERTKLGSLIQKGTVSARNMIDKLGEYEDAEEQGLLLKLPCKVGSTVYVINSRYTKCTREQQEFNEYHCQGCEWLDCDSHEEHYIHTNKSVSLEWIVMYSKDIGKNVFLTKEEAEQALAEMKGV